LSRFLAGFSEIALTTPRELIGSGLTSRECKGVNDPLMVQSLVLESDENRIAILAFDSLAIETEDANEIRRRLAPLGFQAQDVLVSASHTHSGPPTLDFGFVRKNRELMAEIATKAEESVRMSVQSLSSASMRAGFTEFPYVANRRQRTALGRVKLGVNLKGPVDRQISSVLLETGQAKVLMLSYGCHPVMTREIPLASADYIYGIRLQAASLGIDGALFLVGAIGDVNPYDIEKRVSLDRAGVEAAVSYGARMASEGVKSLGTEHEGNLYPISVTTDCKISMRRFEGEVVDDKVLVQALRIGPLILVAFPGEVFAKIALDLKTRLNRNEIAIVSCANGYVGYLPPSNEYSRKGYEIMETPRVFGHSVIQGTSEDLMDAAERLVTSIEESGP